MTTMKRLLLLLLLASPTFGHDWTLYHPNVPAPKIIELDPPQTNTFCAANLTCTVSAAWTFSTNLTVSGTLTCTIVNAVRCLSATNPQGWTGSDLGAQINSAFAGTSSNGTFSNCNTTGACEVDVADGTYTVSTAVAPTGANLFLKFGLVTVTWNAQLNLSAANGFHLKGAGAGFLQSSGCPFTGTSPTKFINGQSNASLILVQPGTNVVIAGDIFEDFAIFGNGSGATSGSDIWLNAIQGASNIATVRNSYISRVFLYGAKDYGIRMTGAVFLTSVSGQALCNGNSGVLVEPGASTVVASQLYISMDSESSTTGYGMDFEGPGTDVYVATYTNTVQGNALGGALCNGMQCRFNNFHVEGQGIFDIKFTGNVSGSSVTNSNLAGNVASPSGPGIWNQSSGILYVADNVLGNGHLANKDIFNDSGGTNLILDPQNAPFSITDSNPTLTQRRDLFPSTGRTTVSLTNGDTNHTIPIPTGSTTRLDVTGVSGPFNLGGFASPGVQGRPLTVCNATTQPMTVDNLDASSSVTARILVPGAVNLPLGGGNICVDFSYETVDNLWFVRSWSNTFTGSGANVLATSPALTTPTIGGGSTLNAVFRVSGVSLNSAFTAITAPACQEQTLTVTGAATTGTASVQPTATIGLNFSWSSWVSASNTVTVRVCAFVTGTPTSVTWNAVVIQ